MTFKGMVNNYTITENGFTAKKLDGMALIELKK
jgi:hypothetical protein